MTYIVVIESRSHNFNYDTLYNKIKSIANDYTQAMNCLWFIYSDKQLNIKEIIKELCKYIGLYDLLFVSELPCSAKKEGKLLLPVWDFIKKYEIKS